MSTRSLSKPEIVILDEPSFDTHSFLDLIGYEPIAETQHALPGVHKFSNVTLKRGVMDSAGGGGSEPPIHVTPTWTDHNGHDPGINGDVVVDDDWLM